MKIKFMSSKSWFILKGIFIVEQIVSISVTGGNICLKVKKKTSSGKTVNVFIWISQFTEKGLAISMKKGCYQLYKF